jgi:hypothetical protein
MLRQPLTQQPKPTVASLPRTSVVDRPGHPLGNCTRWVSIGLFVLFLIFFIITPITAKYFPECSTSADCYDPFGCTVEGRCNCTNTDFAPAYRTYRCDPAGIAYHSDPIWAVTSTFFIFGLIWFTCCDLNVTNYVSYLNYVDDLNERVHKLEEAIKND